MLHLFIALGNPGPHYELSRHNYAWLVADQLEDRLSVLGLERRPSYTLHRAKHGEKLLLLCRPLTYMNRSGIAVANVLRQYNLEVERMVVMHDDIDIPFGQMRVKVGGGHGGHKGMISVIRELGRSDFIRLRLGIGVEPKPPDVTSYVLQPFNEDELKQLETLLQTAVEAALELLYKDPIYVMNKFNRRALTNDSEQRSPNSGMKETLDKEVK